MRELHLDFETFSALDLTEVGAHKYFQHDSTDIWCAGWAFDDEEPQIWHPGVCCPGEIDQHIRQGGVITAWNAAFERLGWQIMVNKYWWPSVEDAQFRCTMTEALGMAFPGKLDKAAPAMGLEMRKDEKGHRLMMQMCRPRKVKGSDAIHKWDDPEKKQRLYEYCKQDVRVEAALGKRLLRLRPLEKKLYFLDMKINDRGVYIDEKLCNASAGVVAGSMEKLNAEMHAVTQGAVSAVTNTNSLCLWLRDRGVWNESIDREHVEDLLICELPDDCRRALELRQEGAKTSVAKIKSMLARRQADGRMRGNLQFYGAGQTGRWAARGAQLQNLPRPTILGSKKEEPTPLEEQVDNAVYAIEKGDVELLTMAYGAPLNIVSDCVRSMIVAPPGNDLMSSDFSNIEGRGVAWGAGQEDKLEAFRLYDRKQGPDLYLVAAGGVYNLPFSEAKPHRQIGKVAELSLGYQGGPRAFAKMAKNYGVRIGKLYGPIWEMAEHSFKERAEEGWADRGKRTGMEREAWLASEVIKLAWRSKNWKIVNYWRDVEEAAIEAVRQPGLITKAGPVKFKKSGSFMFCLLPSGRGICYPYATLREQTTDWGEKKQMVIYKSVNQFTRRWEDKAYYGGLGVENITQAISRDIMAEAMLRVEHAGYPIVLTVHDEIIAEIPEDFGSLDEYNELMTTMPEWAPGFPITVGGWRGKRYRKG